MTYENVDVYLKDKTPAANPVSGVVIKLMNQQGTLVFGMAVTDVNGQASFLLASDATYQLRFFKKQVNFSNPKYIFVISAPVAPESNSFDVLCEPFVPPVSSDLRLCVASGFFRRPDGSTAPNVDMHFIAKFDPILLEGDAMLVERVTTRTDKNGYAQLSLVRCAQYDVTIQGFEDYSRTVYVPDQLSVNLPDLLFPVVDRIVFSPPPPFAVPLGDILTVTPTVIASDGRILEGTATADVQWSTSDRDTLGVAVSGATIVFTGIAAGTASVQASRSDTTIVRIPNTPISGVPAQAIIA